MFYYGVDLTETIMGTGMAPGLILALVQRLPHDSHFVLAANGLSEYKNFNLVNSQLADIFDGIMLMIRTQLDTKKKVTLPSAYRPSDHDKEEAPEVTVADLYKRVVGGVSHG